MTYEEILQRMLDRIPNNVDKREGSIIYDALAPAAAFLNLMYIEFDEIMNESFANTASREYLIRRAAERGIEPYPATNAILRGVFTPSNINLTGTRFNIPNRQQTYIVKGMTAAGVYNVECEVPGREGNEYLGTLIPIDYINGLQTAELTELLIPGEDEEETEPLRERYFSSFNIKRYGGNKADYIYETTALPGVGATKVIPVWNGGGTVKLIILDSNYNKATQTLINNVQDAIDPPPRGTGVGIAPIGHTVTVDTVTETTINISTALTYVSGFNWTMIQQEAIQVIQNYLMELRQTWKNEPFLIVRISQIETRILAIQGVADVGNTRINNVAANLQLSENAVPVYGGITPQ